MQERWVVDAATRTAVNVAVGGLVKVIYGQDIGNEVVRLVDRAEGNLVLVTGYFHPWPRLTRGVESALVRGTTVVLVLRQSL